MSCIKEVRNYKGEVYKTAQSKVYNLKEISDYLLKCKNEKDTKIKFTIFDSGEIFIATTNNESPNYIASTFTPVEE